MQHSNKFKKSTFQIINQILFDLWLGFSVIWVGLELTNQVESNPASWTVIGLGLIWFVLYYNTSLSEPNY